jgi:phenylpropionate dioxygenase-like ring-hydroxylating dioxygenase large terminal subunit
MSAPPGGEQVRQALRRCWQPLARVEDLRSGPRRAVLGGEALTVFMTESDEPAVLADRCPHRGASLSMGAVRGESIECPYHGWRWRGGDGSCARIPSLAEQARIPERAVAKAYPARTRWGLVWSVLEDPFTAMPEFDWFSEESWNWAQGEPFEVPVSIGVVIENFRDVAHFAFVHRESLGAMPEIVEPLSPQRDGLEVTLQRPMRAGEGSMKSWGSLREIRYHAIAPNVTSARMWTSEGERCLVHAARAISETESAHYWLAGISEDFQGASLEEVLGAETQVYAEDRAVVATVTPPELPLGETDLSTLADRFTLEYRRAFADFVRSAGGAG